MPIPPWFHVVARRYALGLHFESGGYWAPLYSTTFGGMMPNARAKPATTAAALLAANPT
jgi:hypothetical protein